MIKEIPKFRLAEAVAGLYGVKYGYKDGKLFKSAGIERYYALVIKDKNEVQFVRKDWKTTKPLENYQYLIDRGEWIPLTKDPGW